jgi:hypothetical protein
MIRQTVAAAFPAVLVGWLGVCPATAETFDQVTFDRMLRENVRDEQVDYLTIRKNDLIALDAYLASFASFDPQKLPRDEQLALYVNLYNATVIRAVITNFSDGYTVSAVDSAVFKQPLVRVDGKTMSLNDLENKVIRPTFKDPRVHAALVCAARSCPPLLPRAYPGGDLDEVLEANMRRFVTDATRNRVDHKRRTLHLSRIFDWYADDFGGRDNLAQYVDRYHPDDVAGYKVEFIDYSWELNLAPPRQGRWIRVMAQEAKLSASADGDLIVGLAGRDQVFEVLEERGERLRITRPLTDDRGWIETASTGPYPASE